MPHSPVKKQDMVVNRYNYVTLRKQMPIKIPTVHLILCFSFINLGQFTHVLAL